MSKLEILKSAVGMVVGAGVTSIIAGVVDSNVEQETAVQKVIVKAGKVGIAMVLSDKVRDHTDEKIQNLADSVQKILSEYNKTQS